MTFPGLPLMIRPASQGMTAPSGFAGPDIPPFGCRITHIQGIGLGVGNHVCPHGYERPLADMNPVTNRRVHSEIAIGIDGAMTGKDHM